MVRIGYVTERTAEIELLQERIDRFAEGYWMNHSLLTRSYSRVAGFHADVFFIDAAGLSNVRYSLLVRAGIEATPIILLGEAHSMRPLINAVVRLDVEQEYFDRAVVRALQRAGKGILEEELVASRPDHLHSAASVA